MTPEEILQTITPRGFAPSAKQAYDAMELYASQQSAALESENKELRKVLKELESRHLKLLDEYAVLDNMVKVAKRER